MSIYEDSSDRIEIERVSFARDVGLKQLANTIPQLAWMANPDGQVHWYNDRWYEYTGTSPEDVHGWKWQSVHDPEVLPEVLERWKRSIETGLPFQMTFPLRGKDGIFRPFFTLIAPLKDPSGKVLQWFGTNTDVSTLEEKEHALGNALYELKDESRRKDEFLAMLGHELRNPLAPISASAQILAKILVNSASFIQDQELARQATQIISRQVKHLTELVDNLLDVSRVIRGVVQLEKENLDLKNVLSSAIEQVRPLLEAKSHTFKASIRPEPVPVHAEPVPVHGDRTRLIQVIVNLLNNAIKYTPPEGEIVLGVAVQDGEVETYVADNGVGIDQSLLLRVFDLFAQAERTSDRSQGGLGIGLPLVRSIMAMHGGQVRASSEGLGKGSTFTLTLPLVAEGERQQEAQLGSAGPLETVKSVRVMIVDDNQDAGQSLAALLEAEGHEVTVTVDARSALSESEANFPQVFILDIGLPDMSGYDLIKRLRLRPVATQAIFIALTGYGQALDRALSQAAGFDHHFVKPVDPRELARIFSKLS